MGTTRGIGVFVGVIAALVSQVIVHATAYGDDPPGAFAFRFLLGPGPVMVLTIALAIGVWCLVAAVRSGTRRLRGPGAWFAAFGWAMLTALVVNVLAILGFALDGSGYWMLIVFAMGIQTLFVSLIAAPVILALTVGALRIGAPPAGPMGPGARPAER